MGFAVSIVVPARAGELARAEWLAGGRGLPRATILGSILLDQVVNAVGLFTGVAVLPFLLDLPPWLHYGDLARRSAVFAVAASVVVVFRPRAGRPALGGAVRRRAGESRRRVAGFVARARLGPRPCTTAARSLARYGAALAAWFLEIVVVYFTLHAFDIPVPGRRSLLVLVAVEPGPGRALRAAGRTSARSRSAPRSP